MTVYLSHVLSAKTPLYGNREKILINRNSCMEKGDRANTESISMPLHSGTHIDLPYHFYENGATLEKYDACFWIFDAPVFLDVEPQNTILKQEIINAFPKGNKDADIVIVRTGCGKFRGQERYWKENYGFHPDLYEELMNRFPGIKVFGFDSISVSSLSDRQTGYKAHRKFLNPERPILLLEDMDLFRVPANSCFKRIIVCPLLVQGCGGLPCTVLGFID